MRLSMHFRPFSTDFWPFSTEIRPFFGRVPTVFVRCSTVSLLNMGDIMGSSGVRILRRIDEELHETTFHR